MTTRGFDIKAVLLVGGLGTRLRSVVPTKPKPLAAVGGRPFLELLLRQLAFQGFRHVVFCTGYRAEDIELQFGDGSAWGMSIEYSREPKPLGTAGALKFAEPYLVDSPEFLVMNGDSFVEIDLHNLISLHQQSAGIASIAVIRCKNEMRYGTVQTSAQNRVVGFAEKTAAKPNGLINAGVYVFNRNVLARIPSGTASLEREIFPALLGDGVFAFEHQGMFIDIGTPEDYARAQELCDKLRASAAATRGVRADEKLETRSESARRLDEKHN